ncbi:MAG: DNA-directed RNA polymerase subunit beta [Kiritimatiellae bacterium]|nr:DNA-directed RNA polymerase subunit beta [Kiritimatiellia bacterium]
MIKRQSFGKLNPVIPPPNLIEIQTKSYKDFLQEGVPAPERENVGLQAAFNEIFPITSADGKYTLEFVSYRFETPRFTDLEALADGGTYAAPLRVVFRLKDGEESRQEEVFMGDIPLMTRDGAFVVNGAERVIVSQLSRSPGVSTEVSTHANGQPIYAVRIIPDRGNWVEMMFDTSDVIWVYLDRKRRRRKFLATTFLRGLGYGSDEDILGLFYQFREIVLDSTVKVQKGSKDKIRLADLNADALKHFHFKNDVIDTDSRAVLARRYEPVSEAVLHQMSQAGIQTVEVVDVSWDEGIILKTLRVDPTHDETKALEEIYRHMRPGDPASSSNAKSYLHHNFFERRHYDLTKVGRHKINLRLGLEGKVPEDLRTLDEKGLDVIESLKLLLEVRVGRQQVDDIDHLGNRRIRTAGELVENACRQGLSRTEHLIRDRMSTYDSASGVIMPSKLVNSKSLSTAIQDFFGRSQLSQFMDQTNPLSSLAHKRRLSALGPGGLNRERAGFEVRDVHTSHYGRICPIETPEGPNIGLISSLGLYAHINEYGFIESPYRKVVNGKVTNEVVYMAADVEEQFVIAQANSLLSKDGKFLTERVSARYNTEFMEVPSSTVQYMDVSPMQVISIAAGLIPFLEHDDANRALMGANMMRQAVPLLRPDRPYVATGLEERAAIDSCVTVLAEQDGIVAFVSATKVVVTATGKLPPKNRKRQGDDFKIYELQKFRRTNATTCFNQKPIVKVGDKVKKGDCLADGPSTRGGELSLGKNLLCAYMPWNGYNFEDAILVSERVVRDDVFTSVHIQTYEVEARDTKLGVEEITRDIPNVGEFQLRNLDSQGVIRIGAEIKPGDILVGKISPKAEQELAPEERLLRAIFGSKAAEVRDTSLKVPSGIFGVVMNVKTITKQDISRGVGRTIPSRTAKAEDELPDPVEDDDNLDINAETGDIEDADTVTLPSEEKTAEDIENERLKRVKDAEEDLRIVLAKMIGGETLDFDIVDDAAQEPIVAAGHKISKRHISKIADLHGHVTLAGAPDDDERVQIIAKYRERFEELDAASFGLDFNSEGGDGDVVKKVRVYIAEKKNLSVGDKLAGRHGNKGVVSRIVKDCDMPYLPDGTPVDIVLNPLGVPSRMNLGQLFEAYLGLACRELGIYAATPVFDGAQEAQIDELLAKAHNSQVKRGIKPWINVDGKSVVYDGRTGQPFDQRIVVGGTYFLKLHHLVTDKIHARATGPYSLVTQQPLGGKAQYGGQRMGEMEVWALEAYGVAYALQELLTVKSDDTVGRTRIYESIVKGNNTLNAGMPESFSVLMNELRGLCLDMKLLGDENEEEDSLLSSESPLF